MVCVRWRKAMRRSRHTQHVNREWVAEHLLRAMLSDAYRLMVDELRADLSDMQDVKITRWHRSYQQQHLANWTPGSRPERNAFQLRTRPLDDREVGPCDAYSPPSVCQRRAAGDWGLAAAAVGRRRVAAHALRGGKGGHSSHIRSSWGRWRPVVPLGSCLRSVLPLR